MAPTWYYKLGMEALGWIGILCIMGGFVMVSFGLISPEGFLYPFINGLGAAALIVTSWYKRFYQLVVLNVVWLGISVTAISRLFW